MPDEPILRARHGTVLELLFNNPNRRNGLTIAMADGLCLALAEAAGDGAVRAIVLGGVSGHFCSGADLGAAMAAADPSPEGRRTIARTVLVERFHPALRAIWECPKPTVARLTGATVGFGLSLALACDLRVMATDAHLACGFLKIGLFPDGAALYQLDRLVGLSRARELLLDPERRLVGPEAMEWGLLARLVSSAEVEACARALAARLALGPLGVLREAKRLLRAPARTLDEALAAEVDPVRECLAADDAAEGLLAFFEKRAPRFGDAP